MKLRKLYILSACLLVVCTGCSQNTSEQTTPQETDTQTTLQETETQENAQEVNIENSDIHVTVQSVDISLDDLKALDYTVPVIISLDKNAGISYAEWGCYVDERCTFTTTTKGMDYSVSAAVNDEKHFFWTAWASSNVYDYTGNLLQLNVTLPEDAAVGDVYTILYADTSMADKPHVWTGADDIDWASDGVVTWSDGNITVCES